MNKQQRLILLLIFISLIVFLPLYSNNLTTTKTTTHKNLSISKTDIFMSDMTNISIKQELGRSSWRLLHTMAQKFPFEPSKKQQDQLVNFIYLFANLYPCGDCARHFTEILTNHPPQPESRHSIVQWTCKVHNIVNERLKKPLFDCTTVEGIWQCGCDEDEKKKEVKGKLE